jgi:predicted histone-like DNA-binding protein
MSSIKFTLPYVLQEMNNIHEEKEKTELKPRVKVYDTLNTESVARKAVLHRRCNGSAAATKAVIDDFFQEVKEQLAAGNTVKLDGIGTFSLSLSDRKREARRDEDGNALSRPNAVSIYVSGINFNPDKSFLKEVDSMAEPERVGTTLQQKSPYSTNERLLKLKKYLEQYGYIKVAVYAVLVGLGRSKATKELNDFCQDPESGITWEGKRSTKQYILKK